MFEGKWITTEEQWDNMHFIFEKCIALDCFENARIVITADDYYKLKINGSFVGQGPAPAYSNDYKFNEFDITEYLKSGDNRISVHCYYQGLTNRVWVSGDNIFGMIADIYVDGRLLCSTDKSWTYRIDNTFVDSDTVGYDTAFLENRDMTRGKTEPKNAVEIPCPHRFADEAFPSVVVEMISAKPEISGNCYRCDFCREYAGAPVVSAFANEEGRQIIIRCAEEFCEDGSLRCDMRCGCKYEEKCTLKRGENLIEQYDYKAFRYVEVVADDGVTVKDIKLAVRHYPFCKNAQSINTSRKNLRAVFQLCKDTLCYGVQEALIDCPTREKGQYLGDAYIAGFAHFYLTKDSRLLKKALYDFASSAEYCGSFLSVAPCSYRQKIADYDLLYPHFLLKYYLLTGDKQTLSALAPVCDGILAEYKQYENARGLLENVTSGWNLVDWPDNMRDGYEYGSDKEYGFHNVINAFYVFAITCVNEINGILKRDNQQNADRLINAYNDAFFNAKSGLYTDCFGSKHSSVHANMLPLALALCPKENKKGVAEYLLKRGMCCSVYMSYFYLKALCASGYESRALEIIESEGENSWMNMLKEGATATFEAWGKDQKHNTSLFHPWATSPILILNEHFPNLLSRQTQKLPLYYCLQILNIV